MTAPKPLSDLISLAGRTAIVTGAGQGIGAAIASRLAEAGASVVLADLDLGRAQAAAAEIKQKGGRALPLQTDVADPAEADRILTAAADEFGGIYCLVNNAGIYPPAPIFEMSPDLWDKTEAVNLRSVVFWSRAAAQRMIAQKSGGRIINLSSGLATRPIPDMAYYSALKSGVAALSRALAVEFGQFGICVNAIAPGPTDTPGLRHRAAELQGIDVDKLALPPARALLGRIGTADDIANAILFLASDLSAYITGVEIPVDGGYLLA